MITHARRRAGEIMSPPSAPFLYNLSIGGKLTMGFGLLVVLTLLVVALTYFASAEATTTINRTGELRVPAALAASRAQANLLQIFADVRGYLAFGDRQYIESYRQVERDFLANLDELEHISQAFDPENKQRLVELKRIYGRWTRLTDRLFAVRDDQLEREPAYRWLNTTGTEHSGAVLINVGQMIEAQVRREPSRQNTDLLEDLNEFRGSFTALFSGLRGYVTTRNSNFRYYEYELNLEINEEVWSKLVQNRDFLTGEQQARLDQIRVEREQLVNEVPAEVFAVLESDRWREDLYLFDSQVEPLTIEMQRLLLEITDSQQAALSDDLRRGSEGLNRSRGQALTGGVIAAILGIGMAFIFWRIISGPVGRLTTIAIQIQRGDLEVMAQVESGDEIGTFARTFNSMTAQLRQTLQQIRKEKKRADDLLNVVIPIGVALSSERDFDRLLEQMLVEAQALCNADGGTLYLRTDDDLLQWVIVRNTSLQIALGGTTGQTITFPALRMYDESTGEPNHRYVVTHAALIGTTINIADAYDAEGFDFSGTRAFDQQTGYRSTSSLNVPLKDSHGRVIGVLQLINARNPETNLIIPFDANLQQMMESFSSLAATALESYIREQSLRQEIQQLRIKIDERQQQQQVIEIIETDFFQDLQAKARMLRTRRRA
jgi:CHASE3 domain sensor protein/GAF domain-containing protein